MAFTLIDNQPRSKLSEGRNWGIGFGYCQRAGDTLTVLDSMSPCRDFLAERCAAEALKKPVSAFGLTSVPCGVFDNQPLAYLAYGIFKRGKTEVEYEDYAKHLTQIAANRAHMQTMVNHVETLLKIDGRTVLESISDNRYVAIMPIVHAQSTFMTSLITLLMRAALSWDGTGDPFAFLRSVPGEDQYYLTPALKKIERMAKEGVPTQDWGASRGWHSYGIASVEWAPGATKA